MRLYLLLCVSYHTYSMYIVIQQTELNDFYVLMFLLCFVRDIIRLEFWLFGRRSVYCFIFEHSALIEHYIPVLRCVHIRTLQSLLWLFIDQVAIKCQFKLAYVTISLSLSITQNGKIELQ